MRAILSIVAVAVSLLGAVPAAAAPVAAGCSDLLAPGAVDPLPSDEVDAPNVPLDSQLIVSPALVDTAATRLTPGDSFTCTITLRNRYPRRMTFRLSTSTLQGSRDPDVGVEFLAADAGAGTGAWLDPVAGDVSLGPRHVARMPVRVTIPVDAEPGAAFASLDITSSPPDGAEAGANVGVEARVAVPFLLNVGTAADPRLRIGTVRAPRLRLGRDAWTLRSSVTNTGSVHAVPRGRVRVQSLLGNTVAELPLGVRPLLPGGRAELQATWRRVPWLGIYRYELRLSAGESTARSGGWLVTLPPAPVLVALALAVAALLVVRRRRRSRTDLHEDADEWSEGEA